MNIHKTYEDASGQEINLSKSEVFFSRNISMAAQEDLSRIMRVRHVLGTGTYFGLPSMVGRSKKSIFSFVKDRIWKHINSWRGRALSKAGKEVMIKSVLQAIPSYVMSVYLIPETVIKEIERMLNSFWWGGGSNNGGIKWLAWNRMTFPKAYGGLGFRNLHLFNMAMVAKQGWKFISKPNSLVARVYKARYFPNSSFFASNLGHNPSYAWSSIWKSRHVTLNGCRWRIGDGTKINIMHEPWLRKEDGKWLQSPQEQGVANLCVNQLMCQNGKFWDSNKIHSLFPTCVANAILAVPLFEDIEEDHLVWDDDIHGIYNVKSGYNLLLHSSMNVATAQEGDEAWKWIWKIQAPPKTKHLLWRICKGCLPTRTRLVERHVQCPTSCPICELEEESDWHILFECDNSKRAWQGAGLDHVILPIIQNATSVKEAILKMCQSSGRKEAGRAAMLLWVLWKNRNNWVWNHEKEHGQHLGYKAMQLWHEWEAIQLVYSSSTQQEQQPRLVTWQPPPQGKYKCNIDVGVHGEEKKTSMGWCVRDHRGQFVLGGTSWIYGNCTSNEGEALALLEAMKELQQRGFNDVIFETDAQNIVNATRHRTIGVSEFSSIIHKIKCMLSLNTGFEVKSIRRQANRVAHTLARAALSWSRSHVFDLIPLCIHNLLYNEMI
jgi:ribonuclease HI